MCCVWVKYTLIEYHYTGQAKILYRITLLEGDDALVDEEFWKMDLFKEEEDDAEYESEEGSLVVLLTIQ